MEKRVLIIGAAGQIGTELTAALRQKYGSDNVIASDIKEMYFNLVPEGPFEILDATDFDHIQKIVEQYKITEVYLMAAMLSAVAEKAPMKAWDLNMNSLFHVLNLAKEGRIQKVFWPSSIAIFGSSTPKTNTPQLTITEPNTVYGISKLTGERWCEYYFNRYGVDVRSIRYPGLISYKTPPGGGTTDYAVEIYHEALKENKYTCFLKEDTELPMMFMDDAIRATIDLMEADKEKIKIRSSYNLAGLSFTPKEIAQNIQRYLPEFEIDYDPDFRQAIADSWPDSIDDSSARKDWGWESQVSLDRMTQIMLKNLEPEYSK